MPAPRNRRHIFVTALPDVDDFTSRRSARAKSIARPQDPVAHAARLNAAVVSAHGEALERRGAVGPQIEQALSGIYLEFESPPGVDLKLESLESKQSGIQLIAVKREPSGQDGLLIEKATV